MAANTNVVRDMNVGHQEVIVADRSQHPAAFGAAMDGHELADLVAVPDTCGRALAFVFQILRDHPDCRVREENVILANFRGAFHEHMSLEDGACADFHIRPDHGVWSDFSGRMNARSRIDDGSRMNRHRGYLCRYGRSASLQSISASATTDPFTLAVPNILATVSLRLPTFISMRS